MSARYLTPQALCGELLEALTQEPATAPDLAARCDLDERLTAVALQSLCLQGRVTTNSALVYAAADTNRHEQ